MYLAMGMTPTQYWDEDPRLAIAYREAHRLRRQEDNENAWLHGMYVYDALAVALSNAFGKRGSKKLNYIERPVDIMPLTEEEKRRREAEEYKKMDAAMRAMIARQKSEKAKG